MFDNENIEIILPAIKVAKKSLELSIQANNQDYVKMNNDSISEWSKK